MTGPLDLNNSGLHTLSIRLSADGFSFSLLDPANESAFMHVPYRVEPDISLTANLKRALASNEFLNHSFKEVSVLVETTAYTLIPFELFEDEQVEEIYYYNHPRRHNEAILYNILDRSNMVVVFAMDKTTCSLIDEQFPNARIFATVSPVIEHCTIKSRMGSSRKLYLNLHRRAADLIVCEHGRTLLANTFSCRGGMADCLYYTLNVWKQLGLSQETDEIYLLGDAEWRDELAVSLREYVKVVVQVNPAAEFNRSPLASGERLPYDLLTLLLGNL